MHLLVHAFVLALHAALRHHRERSSRPNISVIHSKSVRQSFKAICALAQQRSRHPSTTHASVRVVVEANAGLFHRVHCILLRVRVANIERMGTSPTAAARAAQQVLCEIVMPRRRQRWHRVRRLLLQSVRGRHRFACAWIVMLVAVAIDSAAVTEVGGCLRSILHIASPC